MLWDRSPHNTKEAIMPLPIQKQVPIPKATRPYTARTRKYPLDTMRVGDMFFVPNRERNTLSTHTSTVGKKLGKKFTTRLTYMKKTDEGWRPCAADEPNAVLGVGVWRVV